MHEIDSSPSIQQEKISLLLKQTEISSYGAIIAALLGFAILSWRYYTPWLALWLAGIIAISLIRLHLHSRYKTLCSSQDCDWRHWSKAHKGTLLASGLTWGLLVLYPASVLPAALQPLPLLGPAIVAVVALSTYGICIDHYRTFLIGILTSLTLSYGIVHGIESLPVIIIFGTMGLLLDTVARRYSVILERSLIDRHHIEAAHNKLEQANRDLAKQHELLIQEERIARHVFEQLTLGSDHNMPGVSTWNQAMGNLSGDLVQVSRSPDGDIYIFLGDFTGHGLPAALGAVPASTVFHTMVSKGLAVSLIAEELNRKLYSLLPTGYFCCAAILRLSSDRKRFTLWLGGLPPVLVRRKHDGTLYDIPADNLPLGVVNTNEFSSTCSERTLEDGDRMLVYSDGLTEAENIDGEMWSRERFTHFLQQIEDDCPVLDKLQEEILAFTHLAPPSDDISVIEIQAGKLSGKDLKVA